MSITRSEIGSSMIGYFWRNRTSYAEATRLINTAERSGCANLTQAEACRVFEYEINRAYLGADFEQIGYYLQACQLLYLYPSIPLVVGHPDARVIPVESMIEHRRQTVGRVLSDQRQVIVAGMCFNLCEDLVRGLEAEIDSGAGPNVKTYPGKFLSYHFARILERNPMLPEIVGTERDFLSGPFEVYLSGLVAESNMLGY